MGGEWKNYSFNKAVHINPKVILKKGESYPFVDMKGINPGLRDVSESEHRVITGGGSRFQPYDTLMARITPCLENGKVARYVPSNNNEGPAFGSTEFIVIRGKEGVTDNSFAYYLAQWQEFRQFAISQMTGSSGRQRVPVESLAAFNVFLPSFSEQQAIAQILGTLDDKIELNRKMNETLEAISETLFKSWFIDFDPVKAKAEGRKLAGMSEEIGALFPDSFQNSELGRIPKGWSICKITEIANVIYGAAFSSAMFNELGNGLPLIRIRDLSRQAPTVYTTQEHPKGYLITPGDLIVGMDGEFRAHIWCGPKSWLNQRVCCFSPKKGIPRSFIHYSLIAPLQYFEKTKTGTTVIHLGKEDIDTIRIVYPPEALLKAFGTTIDAVDSQFVANAQQSRILTSIRDTLLPKLISGELRIKDAEKLVSTIT